MPLLSDFNALSADQVQLATLQGNVVTAQASLDAANAAVAAENTTIGNDTATVVTDLQAPPYGGFAAIVAADGQSVQLLSVVPPATQGAPAGLAVQVIKVAV